MKLDLKSWLTGYMLGICGKPLPIQGKTPTAYSYNGVVLPKLPEWDREQYPYAFIHTLNDGVDGYMLTVCSTKCQISDGLHLTLPVVNGQKCVSLYTTSQEAYERYSKVGFPASSVGLLSWGEVSPPYDVRTDGSISIADVIVWTNYDLTLKGSDTVFLSASDPIPVYE